ncbi:TetR family transcriptional regulator [Microbacterium sp. cx-55]|uniref:TetR/AcrR family transcriptional regulator n=1 Tax=Microbacterium sp. cx-55 TaxID=2875948 RepID=UPI001CC075D7|nr:TetR/AcrR family transcriptional regulator [Microbacterium sp. cx-55]MBZ4487238.1 TetR family transcriptional regulator [Microbacterium sp. cx-55]UGB35262.1 TetR family transcriptional regulator [Microbacterium sp. cx-55]
MTTVTERATRRDATLNRAALVEAAQTLLARDPHASLDAIARAAGLTRRAVYGHFTDRDALVRELVSTGADRFNAIAEQVDVGDDVPLALAQLTARLWSEASHVQVAAALALDDAHVEHTAAALAPLRRRLVHLVREGQDAGTLRTDISAPTLARLVEEIARMVVARLDASSGEASSLAVRTVLGTVGLSWREADALMSAHPSLLTEGV